MQAAKTEMRTVVCDGTVISYEFERKRVKNINLRVRHDCTVHVSASPHVSVQFADDFVRKNAQFVFRALARYKNTVRANESRHRYVSGESIPVLGRALRLSVESARRNSVESDGVFLYLRVRDTEDTALKARVLQRWLLAECKTVFSRIMQTVYPVFEKYGIVFPQLKIRAMKSRWGSCTPAKKCITLNSALFSYPERCIEYVVMHEFCHFIHANHSKRFYELLTVLMPDWKERKKLLESL